jgi:hypothetical protein
MLTAAKLAVASVALISSANAQSGSSYKGIAIADLKHFCVFNDRLFSLGATFCTIKSVAVTCQEVKDKPATWKERSTVDCNGTTSTDASRRGRKGRQR